MITLECCCRTAEEAWEAMTGGAARVELCERLEVGGVTPSVETIKATLRKCDLPVNVLVRPRAGDFVYSEEEIRLMEQQVQICKELGVNGVVIGALNSAGDIDVNTARRLIAAARPLQVTFHRAFDECREPLRALEDIIGLGCERLLTSGHAPSALEGIPLLKRLVGQAGERMIIMPGAGITPDNIGRLVALVGAKEYHGSAHGPSGSTDRNTVSSIVRVPFSFDVLGDY